MNKERMLYKADKKGKCIGKMAFNLVQVDKQFVQFFVELNGNFCSAVQYKKELINIIAS
ncbi:MAG: hypothetical protein ICV65_07305 [Flavisolibacter sp.]|nr:hypothetical protein [Flavisolibacter sp.]